MNRLIALPRDFSITLWVGGLWTIGYLVAPLLFSALADNHALAGVLAGKMFKGIAWVGIACGSLLLLHEVLSFRGGSLKHLVFWLVLLMLAITLIMQFWLQPFVVALRAVGAPVDTLASFPTRSFAFWHGISSMLYLLESLLGLVLVLRSR
jgi:hypothetical protein